MSYFGVPVKTEFPPLIPRHYYSPGAIPMHGLGDDSGGSSWWDQEANWAQQQAQQASQQIQQAVSPAPAPASPAPGSPPATAASNTLLVAGGLALVGVVSLVYLLG